AATDQRVVAELTTDLDRFAYDQALSVFLCAPQALYAVNRHVAFDGYAATFELAETEVAPEHWSRRCPGRQARSWRLVSSSARWSSGPEPWLELGQGGQVSRYL